MCCTLKKHNISEKGQRKDLLQSVLQVALVSISEYSGLEFSFSSCKLTSSFS